MSAEVRPLRLVLKALWLFVVINLLYALVNPRGGQVSGYNVVFPGRTRLPFGISGDPYTVSVDDIDAMFASHRISVPKGPGEFRVALIGDSAIWGEGLSAYEEISEELNRQNLQCGAMSVRAYNLGYPHPSILKDLVILDKTMEYEPDLILWFVTLNTFFSQRINPFLVANRLQAAGLLQDYDIAFREHPVLVRDEPNLYERTLIGRRSSLARQVRLQMLGIIWTATYTDTTPAAIAERADFYVNEDPRYRTLQPPDDIRALLLLDALEAGHRLAGRIPVLIINEPIYIVDESVNGVRYNAAYPRWAYDQYREELASRAQEGGWNYLDLWDAIPRELFLDPGFHLTLDGERRLVQRLSPVVADIACDTKP